MSERVRIFCNNCRNHTIHQLVHSHVPERLEILDLTPGDATPQMIAKVWACSGCDNVTLQEIVIDQNSEEIGSEFYPSREKHHLLPKTYVQLHQKLNRIYREIIISFNNEAQILCAVGLRALLEGICVDKNIPGQTLMRKIDNLSEILPGNIVKGLHYFRTIGNKAVHELNAPNQEKLRQSIMVIEALLNYFYELDLLITGLSEEVGSPNVIDNQTGDNIQTIQRILERSPSIPRGQIDLYRVLYLAGEAGLKMEDIAVQMGRTRREFSGVLGALGRRINHTAGVEGDPGVNYLLRWVTDVNGEIGTYGWSLSDKLRQVIKNNTYWWNKDWK